jgi:hypothetical protein
MVVSPPSAPIGSCAQSAEVKMGAGAIPDEFVCPISGDVMREPVWLSTGATGDLE